MTKQMLQNYENQMVMIRSQLSDLVVPAWIAGIRVARRLSLESGFRRSLPERQMSH
jgi:hypothetical protein